MNRQTHQLIWPRGWLMSKHITLYNTNIYCQGVVMLDFNQNKKDLVWEALVKYSLIAKLLVWTGTRNNYQDIIINHRLLKFFVPI